MKCLICPGTYRTWDMEPGGSIIDISTVSLKRPKLVDVMADEIEHDRADNIRYGATVVINGEEINIYIRPYDILEQINENPQENTFEL